MTVSEMLNKRDIQSVYYSTCQDMLEGSKLLPSEDLEQFDNLDKYSQYILSKFKEYNTDIIIQFGWAFTKDYFHRMMNLYEYSQKADSKIYCLFIFPIMGIIYTNSLDKLKFVINELLRLNQNYILRSDINLTEIFESDNAVEFKFNNNLEVVNFEVKPKSSIIVKDLEEVNYEEDTDNT